MTKVESEFLSAREAAELLGIKLRTLYAYVSRGQVESVPAPAGRARRYRRGDIARLRARRDLRVRGSAGGVASGALRWGEPVLESAITQVTEAGPLYRGQAAVDLARRGVAFESVAELLWSGALPAQRPEWPATLPGVRFAPQRLQKLVPSEASPLAVLSALVPLLGARDAGRYDRRVQAVLPRARVLIRAMTAALGAGTARAGEPIARALARALGARGGARAVAAIDQALILWADHELNVSSFAARVAASANSDVYACVSAGLAALSGPRHGAACDQIEALVAEAGRPANAAQALHARARRGEDVAGFDHPLYPGGDPRAEALLRTAAERATGSQRYRTILALIDVQRGLGRLPTVDTALIALCAALRIPPGRAPGLIAVGRCAGWVAHVLEQYEAGFLIRPRARYAGS